MLPFRQIARVLGVDRRGNRPPTEVLLNFSAEFTRRTAGQLVKGQTDTAGANRMDKTCGGPWWRQTAMDAYQASHKENFEPTAEAVVRAYAQKLAGASNMRQVTVPVRRRLRLQPVYHLVFLTRSESRAQKIVEDNLRNLVRPRSRPSSGPISGCPATRPRVRQSQGLRMDTDPEPRSGGARIAVILVPGLPHRFQSLGQRKGVAVVAPC
jgi:hypothetical protein